LSILVIDKDLFLPHRIKTLSHSKKLTNIDLYVNILNMFINSDGSLPSGMPPGESIELAGFPPKRSMEILPEGILGLLNREEELGGIGSLEDYDIGSPHSPFTVQEKVRRMLERGQMPSLDNGFSFVIDKRPAGHEDDYIPAEDYTRYFSNRKIPLADIGHKLRDHDIGHVSSYQKMFVYGVFADLVQTAASNALGYPDRCRQFAGAMDGFGDAMRNIDDYGRFYHENLGRALGISNAARLNLNSLIDLLPPDTDINNPLGPDRTLFDYVWQAMSLDRYEESARRAVDDARMQGLGLTARGGSYSDRTESFTNPDGEGGAIPIFDLPSIKLVFATGEHPAPQAIPNLPKLISSKTKM